MTQEGGAVAPPAANEESKATLSAVSQKELKRCSKLMEIFYFQDPWRDTRKKEAEIMALQNVQNKDDRLKDSSRIFPLRG